MHLIMHICLIPYLDCFTHAMIIFNPFHGCDEPSLCICLNLACEFLGT